jgi:D-amino-acid dehydrogenase
MTNASSPIVVIGAGIVGAAVASFLQRDGAAVTLVDSGPPGEGASFGNAGCLNGSSVVPVGMPGVWRNVPGWLMDPLGPLSLRLSYLPAVAPWLWKLIRSATPEKVEAQAKALRPMLQPSIETYQMLLKGTGAEHLVHRSGHLFAYKSREAYDKDAAGNALRERNGLSIRTLDADELRQLEPHLSRDYVMARFIEENGHVESPQGLVLALVEAVVRAGGTIKRATVTGFKRDGGAVTAVQTDQGEVPCSAVVLAAGAWSKPLAKMLGDDLPLESERGYHVVLKDPEVAPRIPTMGYEAKSVATPMNMGLRIAGTVEFAGLEAAPDWRRAEILVTHAQAMYPGLARTIGPERFTRWMGHRPSLPDSLPAIGRSSGAANAWLAFGHGHVGLAAGAMTGRLVADLVAGRPPCIPAEPYAPGRWK